MNDTPSTTPTREVVGLFADRDSFEATIKALVKAGFERSDLSLLSSHESLAAAGKPGKPLHDILRALVGELKFEAPLVASGAIFLAGGPMAASGSPTVSGGWPSLPSSHSTGRPAASTLATGRDSSSSMSSPPRSSIREVRRRSSRCWRTRTVTSGRIPSAAVR